MSKLYIRVDYNIKTDTYKLESNIKNSSHEEVITNFLQNEMGKGSDSRLPNNLDNYTIIIYLNLSYDSFTCKDNCGNYGLRDGILLNFLSKSK